MRQTVWVKRLGATRDRESNILLATPNAHPSGARGRTTRSALAVACGNLAKMNGSLDGILTGIRQLRRVRPLETEEIAGLRVPTLAEMARIKAWLLVTRLTTRDYLDTVVLFERLGEEGTRRALHDFDEIYPQPNGASVLAEVIERLGAAHPVDAARIELAGYRNLVSPWNDWQHLAERGRAWAQTLSEMFLQPEGAET